MIRNKFAVFIDSFVLSLIIFVVSFFWIYKITKIKNLSFVLSLLTFVIFFIIFFSHTRNKSKKILKSKSEKNYYDNILKILKFQGIKENSNFFTKLFLCSYLGENLYKNENCIFYINFQNELSSYDFIIANNYYTQTEKNVPLIFLSEKTSDEFQKLLNISPIKYHYFSYVDLIKIMKERKCFPINNQITIQKNNKISIKKIFYKGKEILFKVNFKECFFSGISLVILSIFIPYSLYYLIFGTTLLFLAFFSILTKPNNFQSKNQDKTIDLNDIINKKNE